MPIFGMGAVYVVDDGSFIVPGEAVTWFFGKGMIPCDGGVGGPVDIPGCEPGEAGATPARHPIYPSDEDVT